MSQIIDDSHLSRDLESVISPDLVAAVREYMQDYASVNRLTEKEEYTDGIIRVALLKSLSDISTVAPVAIAFTNFKALPISFALTYAAMNLIEISIFRKLRNDLPGGDGGPTEDTEKYDKYLALLNKMQSTYEPKVANYKRSLNNEQAYGALPSSYLLNFRIS